MIPAPSGGAAAPQKKRWRDLLLMLGALGVVFGDIGTSPIYAMRQAVQATGGEFPGPMAIMGTLSLIFWALIIVVTLKYVGVIMRADNDGEGGTLALSVLAHRSKLGPRMKQIVGAVAILGLALFYGDGVLTPAISVLSAMEGLGTESHFLRPLIIPLSLVVLIGVFAMQSRGTAKLSKLFSPIILVWFVTLSVLGVMSIWQTPSILLAVNPIYAAQLFIHEPWMAFTGLGFVVLAVTGCEALYADMGHFGKEPVRRAWLYIVLPALLMNYFGQGALLLRHPGESANAFYGLAPDWMHYPFVILATLAAIIASQAVISGVFSMTRQAVQLGQLPRMEIRHTSATEVGQIYLPMVNFAMMIGVILIVLIFHTSSALAAAYGIAVAGIMLIETFNVAIVALRQWKWRRRVAIAVFGVFLIIDLAFLSANSLKIVENGWMPLLIAAGVSIIMTTWRKGRRLYVERIRTDSMPLNLFMERADKTPTRVAGTAVFLSPRNDVVPTALLHNLKHNKVLHERVILMTVQVADMPSVPPERRLEVEKLGKGFFAVQMLHGFFETADVPRALEAARAYGLAIDIDTTTFFLGHETLMLSDKPVLGRWRTWLYIKLASSALSPGRFYRLPPNRVVELGTQVSI